MTTTPAVSVVLTTFNGASRGFLRQAIDSVIAQSVKNFELLIVDDGSTDGTEHFCLSFLQDSRVRYIRKANGGAASARNAGIASARAGLICFLDDDDVWVEDKIARQLNVFSSESPRPGLVYSAIEVTDSAGHVVGNQFHEVPPKPYEALFYENFVDATSGVMVTAEALTDVGVFREDVFNGNLQGAEDRELWTRIARKYPIACICDPLVRYRMHAVKLSTTANNMEKSELAMLAIALASAPPEIVAQRSRIYFTIHSRFAFNRFTSGDYGEFVQHYRTARTFGAVAPGLRIRYLLTLFPAVIPISRRMLALAKRTPLVSTGTGLRNTR